MCFCLWVYLLGFVFSFCFDCLIAGCFDFEVGGLVRVVSVWCCCLVNFGWLRCWICELCIILTCFVDLFS